MTELQSYYRSFLLNQSNIHRALPFQKLFCRSSIMHCEQLEELQSITLVVDVFPIAKLREMIQCVPKSKPARE
jgi:hypothetical protein